MDDKQQEIQNRFDQILQEVQTEVQDAHTQTKRRQQLIKRIEEQCGTRILLYVAKLNYPIDYNDIHMVGSMLESVGETDNWKLIFELYLRAELFLDMDNLPQQRKGKLLETSAFSMVSSFPA